MRKKLIKQLSAWLPVILWAALIFHFSSGTVPKVSNIFWQDFTFKKMGHVILFGFLSLLIYRALRINNVNKKTSAVCAVLLSVLYGGTDEYHQMFTQGREPRLRDVFIDGVGSALIILVTYYLPSRLSKKMLLLVEKLNLT
jgi:hypothetical protein